MSLDDEQEMWFRVFHYDLGEEYARARELAQAVVDVSYGPEENVDFHYPSFRRGWDAAVESIGFCPSEETAKSWYY